jgi:hypothetical protein
MKNDGRETAALIEHLLQLQAAHSRHTDIHEVTAVLLGIVTGKKTGRGIISDRCEPQGLQQQPQRTAGGVIVIDDGNDRGSFFQGLLRGTTGFASRKSFAATPKTANTDLSAGDYVFTEVCFVAAPAIVTDRRGIQGQDERQQRTSISQLCHGRCGWV